MPRTRTFVAFLALTLFAFGAPVAASAASSAGAVVPCVDGFAGTYPCDNVDLLSRLTHAATGGGGGNDIWGWTDPETGREYAIVGKTNGTAFVDITDPVNPVYVGRLPSTMTSNVLSSWRDMKVYENHVYIVAEEPVHGVQIFDLTRLRGASPGTTFSIDSNYPLATSAHNIALNEETGFAYVVGHISGLLTPAGGCSGLHMLDLTVPIAPVFAGCFELDGYTHDTQCVVYRGPDERYSGQEICMNSNEDTLTIVDVTNKALATQLSRTGYPGAAYTHQGWFTEDQRYFIVGDEGDEGGSAKTESFVFDVTSLTAPQLIGIHQGRTTAIDHNMYTVGDLLHQANYRAGYAALSLEDVAEGKLRDVGYFDIYPANDGPNFNGAWGVYPYFESGNIVVNGMAEGLFVLRPRITDLGVEVSAPETAAVGGSLTYTVTVENHGPGGAEGVTVTDLLPGSAAFVSASDGCANAGGLVTCDLGSLAEGESAVVTIEVSPTQAGALTNGAQVSADEADHIEGNDSASVTTQIS